MRVIAGYMKDKWIVRAKLVDQVSLLMIDKDMRVTLLMVSSKDLEYFKINSGIDTKVSSEADNVLVNYQNIIGSVKLATVSGRMVHL